MTPQQLVQGGKGALIEARTALAASFQASHDDAERQRIEDASDVIGGLILEIDLADLLSAATIVSNAAGELEEIVATANPQQLGQAFKGVVDALNKLGDARSDIHKNDALRPSEPPAPLPAGQPPAPQPLPPAPTGGPLPPISTATNFAALRPEYDAFFGACAVRPERQGNIDYYLNNIGGQKARYVETVAGLAIPWFFVGIIHGMEAGFNVNRHLHNGDPLSARTTHVPPGRPATGNPPFTWRESALDALKLQSLDNVPEWTVARMLFELERYNGFGYRPFKVPSPYLWSFSTLYSKGKYVADRTYDPNAVSQQCGAGVILKAGKNSGLFV